MTNAVVNNPTTPTLEEKLLLRIEELEAKIDSRTPVGNLPDNAFYGENDGILYHRVTRMTEGGTYVESLRPLALTLEEAREKHMDFYHPKFGLIWEGYKLAKDRPAQDVMSDTSRTIPPTLKEGK